MLCGSIAAQITLFPFTYGAIYEKHPELKDKFVIIYAPTFRDAGKGRQVFEPEIDFDIRSSLTKLLKSSTRMPQLNHSLLRFQIKISQIFHIIICDNNFTCSY